MRDLLVAWNFKITKSFRSRDLIKEITERFCFGLFWVILCSTCHTHNLNHWVEFVFLFFFLLSFTWQIGCNWYICYFFAYLIRMSNLSSLGFCSQMFVLAQWYFFKRFFFQKEKKFCRLTHTNWSGFLPFPFNFHYTIFLNEALVFQDSKTILLTVT